MSISANAESVFGDPARGSTPTGIRSAFATTQHANDHVSTIDALVSGQHRFALVSGDSLEVLRVIPDGTVNCVVTSPPYFRQRLYDVPRTHQHRAIGNEQSIEEYVYRLTEIFSQVRRVLTNDGSLWLNLGDKFIDKELVGVPWRVALALKEDGWILRQDIIWNQMKGTQSARDRMRNIHEHIFHLVKQKRYYFDDSRIRQVPQKPMQIRGKVISATGVSGIKYRRQIEESEMLTKKEKRCAIRALNDAVNEMKHGIIADFRMTIRGVQRVYHSDNGKISGRAKELEQHGYFIMKMRADGFLPSTIWNIVPEDEWRKDSHCAVFPKEIVRTPLLATCPLNGIALDPFSGTGTTVAAALELGMRGIGIDISASYSKVATARMNAVVSNDLFHATATK